MYSGSLLFFYQSPQVEMRVELKNKMLEILKNRFGQFYIFNDFLLAMIYVQFQFYYHVHGNYIISTYKQTIMNIIHSEKNKATKIIK